MPRTAQTDHRAAVMCMTQGTYGDGIAVRMEPSPPLPLDLAEGSKHCYSSCSSSCISYCVLRAVRLQNKVTVSFCSTSIALFGADGRRSLLPGHPGWKTRFGAEGKGQALIGSV